jgi:transaldolase
MPMETLHAFADHGDVEIALTADPSAAERVLAQASAAGLDLDALTSELEREGVHAFCDSYRELLDCIDSKLKVLAGAAG